MGRIEDALRRAAEERVAAHEPPVSGSQREVFPAETDVADSLKRDVATVAAPPVSSADRAAFASVGSGRLFDRLNSALAEKVVVDVKMSQPSREQYRKLAAGLHQAQATSGMKVIMVASAVAGEGKTLTSSNLALTLSESYKRRVLLIDGDLRRPSLHTVFSLDVTTGLSEGLAAPDDRRFAVHEVSPHLTVLPAGRPTHDPMAGLTSERMHRLIEEARAAFDWIIVDTPPVGLLPDGHLLSAMADGVLLVVRAGETPYPMVLRALEAVGRERVLGVILNQVAAAATDAYYSYKYEYGTRPEIAAP